MNTRFDQCVHFSSVRCGSVQIAPKQSDGMEPAHLKDIRSA